MFCVRMVLTVMYVRAANDGRELLRDICCDAGGGATNEAEGAPAW